MIQGKKSIVMALSDLRGGGAERVVVHLLNHWPRDHSRPVLLLAEKRGPYLTDLRADVEVLSCEIPFTAANTPRVLFRLRALLNKVQPIAIFAHSIGTTRMLARARAVGFLTAPLVPVLHNNVGRSLAHQGRGTVFGGGLRRELGWVYSRTTGLIAVSKGIAREAAAVFGIPEGRFEAVYNPIDLAQIDAAQEHFPGEEFTRTFERLRKPIIITVGRLSTQKNHSLLLDAYCQLPPTRRGSLVILGEGPLGDVLESKARELGIGNEVFLPGFVQNPWWYMKRSDLYVLSSSWEGYPMVLIEAMACGLPIVATDCEHGPSEIIYSDALGTLVPVNDAPALAKAIAQRLQANTKGPPLEGRTFVEQYEPASVAKRYADVLATIRPGFAKNNV